MSRRHYPRKSPTISFKSFATRFDKRQDSQDEMLLAIREQTTRTNGRVSKLETQRDTLHDILLKAAAAVAFVVTSGLALYAAIK